MEDILDVYAKTYDEAHPLICMDEAAKQLLADEKPPLPVAPGKPAREDYHYERCGTAALFMFFDPIRGWRRAVARENRTRLDWAEEIRRLLDEDYPLAEQITLVCDNLNTHAIASLYAAFDAPEAHRLARRLDIHYTPRNSSWLNMAEIELSVLARQCLSRRIESLPRLQAELAAWTQQRNADASTVEWRMTTDDARIRLRKTCPTF